MDGNKNEDANSGLYRVVVQEEILFQYTKALEVAQMTLDSVNIGLKFDFLRPWSLINCCSGV